MIPIALICLSLALPVSAQDPKSATPGSSAEPSERSLALQSLRELSELDLVAELIPSGRDWVAAAGVLNQSGEARALVAHALHAAGLESEALELLNSESLPVSERPWIVLERVRLHLQSDELQSALRALTGELRAPAGQRALTPLHADWPESWLLLARTYARAGDLSRAVPPAREFLRRAALHPGASSAWHLLATAALARRDGQRAEECLNRARELERWHQLFRARKLQIRRHPDEPLPRLGLALAWLQVEAYDEARTVLEELARRHPDYARGWFHLGEAQRLLGDLNAAQAAYEQALESDASQHLARFNLAIIDLMSERPQRARAGLELLISNPEVAADPRFLEAHRHLAELCAAAGDEEWAERHRIRYRELTRAATLKSERESKHE